MIPCSGNLSSENLRGPPSRQRMIFQDHFLLPSTGTASIGQDGSKKSGVSGSITVCVMPSTVVDRPAGAAPISLK